MAWNEPGNNNRDPWSQGPGGKRGDTPPDLNELLKRFKQRWGGRDGKGLRGGRDDEQIDGVVPRRRSPSCSRWTCRDGGRKFR